MISPRQYRGLSRVARSQIELYPTVEPVAPTDYQNYKRVKTDEDLGIVNDKLITAREAVEKYTGRALVNQTWNSYWELPPGSFPYFGMTASIFARYFGYQPEGVEIDY